MTMNIEVLDSRLLLYFFLLDSRIYSHHYIETHVFISLKFPLVPQFLLAKAFWGLRVMFVPGKQRNNQENGQVHSLLECIACVPFRSVQ